MKLTKAQIKIQNECEEILQKDKLTYNDKWFIIENWHEGASNNNAQAGAFFTPVGMARDFSIELYESATTIDLCAGIGGLSFFAYHWKDCKDITCVELNSNYVEVGKKILPEANWINGSIFDYKDFGHFDQCISNPPFGKIKTGIDQSIKDELNYKGSEFDLITIEIASKISDYGVFILPQRSTPFRYSNNPTNGLFEDFRTIDDGSRVPRKVKKFIKETGLNYEFNCGIDTGYYKQDWKGVSPTCEIVEFNFNQKN